MPGAIDAVFKNDLVKGDKGADVTRLQKLLATDKSIYPEGLVTGTYGDKTVAAVTRFQLKYGVVASASSAGAGKCGPKTRAKLAEVFAPAEVAWAKPLPAINFVLTQTYLNEDWLLYPKFGHHTGVDYGGKGKTGIPISACADGEIIYRGVEGSTFFAALGNHVALYVPSEDKSFLYCHLAKVPHALGAVTSGEQIGEMGNTGKSAGGAIHLHLEGYHGRFQVSLRTFTSLTDIKKKTFDADAFIRSRI